MAEAIGIDYHVVQKVVKRLILAELARKSKKIEAELAAEFLPDDCNVANKGAIKQENDQPLFQHEVITARLFSREAYRLGHDYILVAVKPHGQCQNFSVDPAPHYGSQPLGSTVKINILDNSTG